MLYYRILTISVILLNNNYCMQKSEHEEKKRKLQQEIKKIATDKLIQYRDELITKFTSLMHETREQNLFNESKIQEIETIFRTTLDKTSADFIKTNNKEEEQKAQEQFTSKQQEIGKEKVLILNNDEKIDEEKFNKIQTEKIQKMLTDHHKYIEAKFFDLNTTMNNEAKIVKEFISKENNNIIKK